MQFHHQTEEAKQSFNGTEKKSNSENILGICSLNLVQKTNQLNALIPSYGGSL
jgi:hypothetical protein